MRSFAPYDRTKIAKPSASKKQRAERYSTEWDIRIDCDPSYADEIIKNIRGAEAMLDYAMVSGIEQADTVEYGSKDNHVHIGLIFKYALRRDQVLGTCRGFAKRTDEYCVPRNKKFTYAGWYMHHAKIDWKMVLEPAMRMELGVLPDDEDTEYNRNAINRLYKKFGCDDATNAEILKIKFAKYLE